MKNKTIAVWFSCGVASAVAAKKTIEKYGDSNNVIVINNPIKEEHSDNKRFLLDIQKWLGVEILTAVNPKYPDCSCVTVWDDRKYMSGIAGAPCTVQLKKEARKHFENTHHIDFHVLGFTSEEEPRATRFIEGERSNMIPVLVNDRISKGECFMIISDAGIKLPEIYKLGFPNANCIGCVKATSATYWNHVRKMFPAVFTDRATQSRRIGAKLVRNKGVRIFLDELPVNAKGAPMKDLNFECGLFCEEFRM